MGLGSSGGSSSSMLSFDPCASDRLMLAATQGLCEKMAGLTGRQLAWAFPTPPRPAGGCTRSSERPSVRPSVRRHSTSARSRRLSSRDGGGYALFISYHRAESGPDARLLQGALEEALSRDTRGRQQQAVFLDATDATEISAILSALEASRAVVLLLTLRVLERPWVLLEVYDTVRLGKPLVPVHIAGAGYDYAEAARYLADLEVNLGDRDAPALAQLRARLAARKPPVSVSQVGALLSDSVPNIIAINFDPVGDDHGDHVHHLNAVATEVVDRVRRATPGS